MYHDVNFFSIPHTAVHMVKLLIILRTKILCLFGQQVNNNIIYVNFGLNICTLYIGTNFLLQNIIHLHVYDSACDVIF